MLSSFKKIKDVQMPNLYICCDFILFEQLSEMQKYMIINEQISYKLITPKKKW